MATLDVKKENLLKALQLSPNVEDVEICMRISTAITDAVHNEANQPSLKDIHDAIILHHGLSLLEPLDVLPDLFWCQRKEALDFISLIALNCSPKEVLIVIQETLEQLTQRTFEFKTEKEHEHISAAEMCSFSASNSKAHCVNAFICCLINLITTSAKSVPRMALGTRAALQVVSPIVSAATSLVSSLGSHCTRDRGRTLLAEVSRMSEAFYSWVLRTGSEPNVVEAMKIIRALLDVTVVGCASCISASLCARAFKMHYPRLASTSVIEPDWQEGEQAIMSVSGALHAMTLSPRDILKNPTTSSLIILAHEQQSYPKDLFFKLHSALVASIQMNIALDESLFLIFRCITQDRTQLDFPLELATSLCIVLPALASTHLDPFIRHFSLRLIALILAQLPPLLRQEILTTLASDPDLPQMRAAAIGLLKEFVLDALQVSALSGEQNIFASPLLLRSFGPILFRTIPPDYLSTIRTADDIEKSLEPSRITEVLSFYYVLLQRDEHNKTGVRNADNIASVESSLLRPLRSFSEKWSNAGTKPILPVIALQIGLERIGHAVQAIRS